MKICFRNMPDFKRKCKCTLQVNICIDSTGLNPVCLGLAYVCPKPLGNTVLKIQHDNVAAIINLLDNR